MLAGEFYDPNDEILSQIRSNVREVTAKYNTTNRDQKAERERLLKGLFGRTGKDITIDPHFNCDYGQNIKVGENFYANFACVILDCAEVIIGDNCMLGLQVGIYNACHPIAPIERVSGIEFAKPIRIGDNS